MGYLNKNSNCIFMRKHKVKWELAPMCANFQRKNIVKISQEQEVPDIKMCYLISIIFQQEYLFIYTYNGRYKKQNIKIEIHKIIQTYNHESPGTSYFTGNLFQLDVQTNLLSRTHEKNAENGRLLIST